MILRQDEPTCYPAIQHASRTLRRGAPTASGLVLGSTPATRRETQASDSDHQCVVPPTLRREPADRGEARARGVDTGARAAPFLRSGEEPGMRAEACGVCRVRSNREGMRLPARSQAKSFGSKPSTLSLLQNGRRNARRPPDLTGCQLLDFPKATAEARLQGAGSRPSRNRWRGTGRRPEYSKSAGFLIFAPSRTTASGGERACRGRLGKDRSSAETRHSIASTT